MCIPQIIDRHPLIDLTNYGSRSRRKIHSDVLIGWHPSFPIFKEGDILDGNAVFNLIQAFNDQGGISEDISKQIQESEERTNARIDDLSVSINNSVQEINDVVNNQQMLIDSNTQNLHNIDARLNNIQTLQVMYNEADEKLIFENQ